MFTEKEKVIFCYEVDGEKYYVDPLDIRRRLVRAGGGEINLIIADAQKEIDPKNPIEVLCKMDAQEKRLVAVRQAFGFAEINPKTGEGVTEATAIGVLYQFLEWLEKNEKTAES